MLIKVQPLGGKQLELEVEPTDSVEKVQEKIQGLGMYPVKMQRLLYCRKEMKPTDKVQEYNITEGATLHMTLRMGGPSLLFYYQSQMD